MKLAQGTFILDELFVKDLQDMQYFCNFEALS